MPHIYVDLIRHGHSCSNLAQDLAVHGRGLHNLKGLYYKFVENDPVLSSLGREMAVVVEHDIRQYNPQGLVEMCDGNKRCPTYLYSSPLRRAIETAHTMWDTKEIRVAPYLLEHGIGHENVPLHREEQKQRLERSDQTIRGKLEQRTVDSKASKRPRNPQSPDAYKTTGNLYKFIEWLQADLGPLSNTEDIFVSVVTHSILMRANLGLPEKPNNQSIYRLSWDIDTWNDTQQKLQIKGRATKIYNGQRVNKKDLARGKLESTQCDWHNGGHPKF